MDLYQLFFCTHCFVDGLIFIISVTMCESILFSNMFQQVLLEKSISFTPLKITTFCAIPHLCNLDKHDMIFHMYPNRIEPFFF